MVDAHSPGTPAAPQPGGSRGRCPHLSPASRLTHRSGGGAARRPGPLSGQNATRRSPAPHGRRPPAGSARKGGQRLEEEVRGTRGQKGRTHHEDEATRQQTSGPMGRRPQRQFTEAPGAGVLHASLRSPQVPGPGGDPETPVWLRPGLVPPSTLPQTHTPSGEDEGNRDLGPAA